MMNIKPFKGVRPRNDLVSKVAAPPYDVLTSEEARLLANKNPYSFLHITKPEIDLAVDINPYSDPVYKKGQENLQKFLSKGIFTQDDTPGFYLYQQCFKDRCQTGFFCLSSIDDYLSGKIKKHELTRAEKELDRSKLIQTLHAQVGPVFLFYKSTEILNDLLLTSTKNKPSTVFSSPDGVSHTLWEIKNPETIQLIQQGFKSIESTYIADGHHRAAAACNVCQLYRKQLKNYTGNEEFNFFLTVIFPHDQLKILPYHRVVKDLNGLSKSSFLAALNNKFNVQKMENRFEPDKRHVFGLYLENEWFSFSPKDKMIEEHHPVDSLDVNILSKNILEPIFNITDLRNDSRIDFIGGNKSLQELETKVDSGQYRIAFALHPISINTLTNIADSNDILPPKSTWFEPKLQSGLVFYLLNDLKNGY